MCRYGRTDQPFVTKSVRLPVVLDVSTFKGVVLYLQTRVYHMRNPISFEISGAHGRPSQRETRLAGRSRGIGERRLWQPEVSFPFFEHALI